MYCSKCNSLMELKYYFEDLSSEKEHSVEIYRCPECGQEEKTITIWSITKEGKK